MLPCLSGFIKEHYEIVAISEKIAVEECDTFLLIENHLDEVLLQCNGLFVDLFATKRSCLLVEGEAGLELSGCPKTQRKISYVDTKKVEQIIGWDMKEFDRQITAPKVAYQLALVVAQRARSLIEVVDWRQEMLEQLQFQQSSVFEEGEQGDYAICEEEISRLSALIQPQQERMIFWQEKLRHLVPHGDVNEELQRIFQNGMVEIGELTNLMTVIHRIEEERSAMYQFIHSQYPNTRKYFPERTQAMVATLDKVREQFSVQGKVFLMAGGHHLKEGERSLPEMVLEENHSLTSLKPLYDWIKDKKVVILKPNWLSF